MTNIQDPICQWHKKQTVKAIKRPLSSCRSSPLHHGVFSPPPLSSLRQRQLEELQVLALQFHEALEPLGEWLSTTERRLSSAEPMGTQTAKITQQIVKHKVPFAPRDPIRVRRWLAFRFYRFSFPVCRGKRRRIHPDEQSRRSSLMKIILEPQSTNLQSKHDLLRVSFFWFLFQWCQVFSL